MELAAKNAFGRWVQARLLGPAPLLGEGQPNIRVALLRMLFIPLALSALIGGLFAWQNQRLVSLTDYVAESEARLAELWETQKMMFEMESSFRGFFLAGDPVHLEPYRKAALTLPTLLEKLRSPAFSSSDQQENLKKFEAELQLWVKSREVALAGTPRTGRSFSPKGASACKRFGS
jgi:CHASE3 domain sensor protein